MTLRLRLQLLLLCSIAVINLSCATSSKDLDAVFDEEQSTITILKAGQILLTQNAPPNHRPYLHPVNPIDGKGSFTQYSPEHHKHQTGVYWGYTDINGRDYFHNPGETHWKRVDVTLEADEDSLVRWSVVYDLLDENGEAVIRETQKWVGRESNGEILADIEWKAEAMVDVTVAAHDYGGLFIRMPWEEGMEGHAINTARQRDQFAEGKKAMWMDVGMKVEGRDDYAHVAVFDHPDNTGFPQNWRVDGQLGIGPSRSIQGDWTIAQGDAEIVKHRLVFYTGKFQEFRDRWDDYIGTENMYSIAHLWDIAREEGKQADFLTPQEAVDNMTVRDGFKVSAFASEPMITQPMAFAWDDKGRMWIAENRDYETRQKGFSNDGGSRILILEDTNRDGVADSRKVFLEGIPFPAAIAIGFGGVYLGAPPHLLFVPDADGDDVADDDIEILLTGWGIRDRHETINSLHWGPDGWLYGLEGFATPSMIRKPDAKDALFKKGDPFPTDFLEREGTAIDGGVWRYHPVKDRFEVVAHGFSNPWGVDYDSKGQMFISACVIPHLFHVVQGGVYQRQGGQHINPYVYDDIDTIVDHRHRSAHGGARVYQSDAFPPEHQGRLFMANIHEHAVLSDVLTKKGSSFVASHGEDFMMANNAAWIGFSMEVGPAGDLYVLDWHDGDICGNDVLDKDTGRVFRISPENSLAEDWEGRYSDLNEMTDLQLVNLQLSKSDWHARRARVILQYRSTQRSIDTGALERMYDLFEQETNQDYRLRILWTLHISAYPDEHFVHDAMEDADEYIRAWAIQMRTEDKLPGKDDQEVFVKLAQTDSSPVVRLYLAGALQRMLEDDRWDLAEALLSRSEDADDSNIPTLLWLGIEPLVGNNIRRAVDLAENSKIDKITKFIARRAVDANKLEELISNMESAERNIELMLDGMLAGLEGRNDIEEPLLWTSLKEKMSGNASAQSTVQSISQYFGDAEAAEQLLAKALDSNQNIEERKNAVRFLSSRQRAELVPHLTGFLDQPDLRIDAIRAVASYDESSLGQELLKRFDSFNSEEKREVGLAMASRSSYGWQFTRSLLAGRIDKSDVPIYVARQLRRVVGNGFVEVWGPIDDLSADLENNFKDYRRLLTPARVAKADSDRGKTVFDINCASCHMMFGQGGKVGPELTGSNRANLDYILTNTLNPSGDVAEDYKATVITTQDGRTYLGNIINETDRQITLRIIGQESINVNKSDIQTSETTEKSLMPEGLLQSMPDKDVLALIAYLRLAENATN